MLESLARDLGVSKHEAVKRAIVESVTARAHKLSVSEASSRARAQYSDLLARLGK